MSLRQLISDAFGLESANLAGQRGATNNQDQLNTLNIVSKGWGLESEKAIQALIKASYAPINDGGTLEKHQRARAKANIASNGINKLVTKYSMESALWQSLPAEIRTITAVPAKACFEYEKLMSACQDRNRHFDLTFKRDQARAALESALWSVFSSIDALDTARTTPNGLQIAQGTSQYQTLGRQFSRNARQINQGMEGAGMESTSITTYADQIFIPKASVFNSWVNTASVIMPKVQQTKTVLNEICEIPVSTKHMIILEKDDAGRVVKEYKREDLYSAMDMKKIAPTLSQMRVRSVKLSAPEKDRAIDLQLDPIALNNNKPFCEPNEHVGPQISIVAVKFDGVTTTTGEIHDIRAGLAQGPALGQLDAKGKVIPYTPNKAKPNEFYNLIFDWDVQNSKLMWTFTKTVPSLPDIEYIEIKANMRDLEQTLKSKIAFKIQEERTVLKTPEIDRYVIPLIPDEDSLIAERGSEYHTNKLVELTSEFTAHKKESIWLEEYKKSRDLLKSAKGLATGVVDSKVLYSEQLITLGTANEVRKEESLAYKLGNNMTVLRDKFAKDANTKDSVQLSLFTGTLNLNVLSNCLRVVTGDISEDSDAKFLGVAQSDRVRAISIGTDMNSPIQAIVVGSDKTDMEAHGYDIASGKTIPDDKIQYMFDIIPTYKDENIQTTVFLEIPTKVISGTEVRANEYPLLPSMIIHEGYKYNVIRPAFGKLTIDGVGFRATTI